MSMMRVLWVVGVMAACSAYVDAHGSLVIPPARNNYRQKDPANMTGNSHMDQVRVVIHTCNNCNHHQATHDAGCIMMQRMLTCVLNDECCVPRCAWVSCLPAQWTAAIAQLPTVTPKAVASSARCGKERT
jgi:hypothetical protein